MALQKPTITQCVDGKGHAWMIVSEEGDDANKWEHRWCQKCGVLTQVTYDPQGQPIAALNDDGTQYLMTPKVLMAVIR
ncbi:MAG: hypothetical protein HQK55_05875 [Deltaproteobacteria bacterium]|nr:hypothetical protein [Deltaproteobacteria bacterium]